MKVVNWFFDRPNTEFFKGWASKWMLGSFLISLSIYVLGNNSNEYRKSVIAFALISLFSIFRNGFVTKLSQQWVLRLTLLFGLYIAFSAFWRPSGLDVFGSQLKHLLFLVVYLSGIAYLQYKIGLIRSFQVVFFASCIVLSVVSIYIFYPEHTWSSRLFSYGNIGNAALLVYGFALGVLCGVFLLFDDIKPLSLRVILGIGTCILTCSALLTQSRGGVIALFFVLVALLCKRYGRQALILTGVLGAAVCLIAYMNLDLRDLRVSSIQARFDIWERMLADMQGRWVFGVGVDGHKLWDLLKPLGSHSHSIYMATYYRGGAIGLLLLFVMLFVLFRQLYINRKERSVQFIAAVLIYCLILSLSDLEDIFRRPSHIWIYFWLPIGLWLGESVKIQERDCCTKAT
ncbi:hypothetical protein A9Q99_17905 [Gammaproteobacteria bacterium 45_16_T64]|nr:hypothetical protein A9Q99_17905 [Gammaproteobacteria bacterium 45_16_T64]